MQRWMNWLHIKNLVEDLEDGGLQDPEFRKSRQMFRSIHMATLDDGARINLADPAVSLFLKMIDVDPDDFEVSLADAVRKLEVWYLINLNKPGIGGYDVPDLDELVNLRLEPNGWTELDRVIKQISEESLSAKVDRLESSLILSPDDPGLNGPMVYSLNLSMSWDGSNCRENVALASSPAEVLNLVDKVLEAQGKSYLQYGYDSMSPAPESLYLKRGDDLLFMAPVKPVFVSQPVGDDYHTYDDHSKPFVDWSQVDWRKHDREMFRALINYVPKPLAHKVKGTFLSDELGM